MSEEEIELGDVENFKSLQDNTFSHSTLVMRAMQKVLENGCTELRPGWFNTKQDMKTGNITRTYIPDTRKSFIESVNTLLMMLSCDLDETAKNNIDKLKKDLESMRMDLTKSNDDEWNKLKDYEQRDNRERGINHISGFIDHPVSKEIWMNFQLETSRKIFCELNNLVKRLDFFASEQAEG